MRILHTADWHMNHQLGRVPLGKSIETSIEQIACLCDRYKVDVLVVAGDLFSGRESREQLRTSMAFLKNTFGPFLKNGGTIITISGNHDSEALFELLRDAFELVSPVQDNAAGVHAGGRIYVAPNPRLLTLSNRQDTSDRQGAKVQFVLMPYPTPRLYLHDSEFKTVAERNAKMAEVYHKMLDELASRLDKSLPTVLVSHVQVGGVSENDLFRPSANNDVIVDSGKLPLSWAYGAFGHIHRQMPAVPGSEKFWYCGSLVPLDAGECSHTKGVLLADILPDGTTRVMRPTQGGSFDDLRLQERSLYDLSKTPLTRDTISNLRATYPDCATALLKYQLLYDPQVDPDPMVLHRQIEAVFPHWYERLPDIMIRPKGPDGGDIEIDDGETVDISNLSHNVREYLASTAVFDTAKEASREDVIALAEKLLTDDVFMGKVEGLRA